MAREITKKCELAWAAGFFDGEGCTRVNRVTNKYDYKYDILSIQITQKDREVLDRFQAAVGVGRIYARADGAFLFSCGKTDDCHEILEKIWPWLSTQKREQANSAIERAVGRVAA